MHYKVSTYMYTCICYKVIHLFLQSGNVHNYRTTDVLYSQLSLSFTRGSNGFNNWMIIIIIIITYEFKKVP